MCTRKQGIRYFEDYDFWCRVSSLGYTGRLLREPLFYYRRHAKGNSANVFATQRRKNKVSKRLGSCGGRIELRALPQVPDGLPASTNLAFRQKRVCTNRYYSKQMKNSPLYVYIDGSPSGSGVLPAV